METVKEQYHYFLGTEIRYLFDLSIDGLIGLLSQTMGNLDQATVHCDEALTFCRNGRLLLSVVLITCMYNFATRVAQGLGVEFPIRTG